MLTPSQQHLLETINNLEHRLFRLSDLEMTLSEAMVSPVLTDDWAMRIDAVLADLRDAKALMEKRWLCKLQEYNAEKGWGFDEP